MDSILIKQISAEETRVLRKKLLRPNLSYEKLVYFGDELLNTFHVGAFYKDNLIGIASICKENKPNDNTPDSWRLRGMAVEPDFRRNKIGHRLLQKCIDHVLSQKGKHIWFNARLVAIDFYKTLGFEITSDIFEIEDIGPHYNMEKFL
ncbi:MAG: GNAT family N-acetyltransferase [Candidatus Sericytochromatia bacterium]